MRARVQSETALQAKIAEAEALKADAEQKRASLQARLDELLTTKEAEIAAVKEEAAAEAVRLSKEAAAAAQAAVRDQLEEKDGSSGDRVGDHPGSERRKHA
jgi:hypothetical protein